MSLVLYFSAVWGWPLCVGRLRLDRIQQQSLFPMAYMSQEFNEGVLAHSHPGEL